MAKRKISVTTEPIPVDAKEQNRLYAPCQRSAVMNCALVEAELNIKSVVESYRESFGLELPPAGTRVWVEYAAGSQFSIIWTGCPDGENILYMWLKSKKQASEIIQKHGWITEQLKMTNLTIQHDGPLDIATGKSRQSRTWKNGQMNWSALVERLSNSQQTFETHAEFLKFEKKRQDEVKDVGAFVGGYLAGGRRLATTVAHRQVITLDLDEATGQEWDTWCLGFGYAACMYSTHKHHPEKPRLRLVIPLDREVASDEYEPIARRISEWLGIEAFDITTYQVHRLMYWPSHPKDVTPVFEYLDAPWLSADYVLGTYTDWKDSSEWPVSSKVDRFIARDIKRQKDPLTKRGAVGAFCRTYDIHEAIGTFLSDVYAPCDMEARYTYKEGSTAAGLITYDDKFAYSHHGTDPVSGKLCNAFDLVRIHKFGLLDEDSRVSREIDLPSYKEMITLTREDSRVKSLVVSEKLAEAKEEFVGVEIDEAEREELDAEGSPKWHKELEIDKAGNILGGIDNVVKILLNDPMLKGRIIYDEFDKRELAIKDLPWRSVRHSQFLKDGDVSNLKHFLKVRYKIQATTVTLEDALKVIYDVNKINSLKDYLDLLQWDEVKRVDTLLVDYLGAEDSKYTRAVTRKTLVAAIARVFEPGTKFDYMLTLIGAQGIGKSTFISRLGGQWFTDTFNFHMLGKKDAYEQLQGAWLVEVGELTGLRKADIEAAKSFLSSREDRYRVSYGRRISYFPRQCIFWGTSNNPTPLRDNTGNRRFWVVKTRETEPVKNLFTDLTEQEVGQIWAEAIRLYQQDEPLFLDAELAEVAASIQEDYTEVDERAGLIQNYIGMEVPANWYELNIQARREYLILEDDPTREKGVMQRNQICAAEIWCELFGKRMEDMNSWNTKFIHDIMTQIEGWVRGKAKRKVPNYGKQAVYLKKELEPLEPVRNR